MILTSEKVSEIFFYCLPKDNEKSENYDIIEGVATKVKFNAERINEKRKEIIALLDELPIEFNKNSGGGWSFLNACNDKDGNQWTGFHKSVDELVTLGLAIKKINWLLPRELWDSLPGAMPFFVVD